MKFSIGSYSFHRLLAAGQQDMFKYITDCKELDMAQLDPWNAHLALLTAADEQLKESGSEVAVFSDEAQAYIEQVKVAADEAGLPFGCVAVDGAHIYEATEEARRINRASAYRWIDAAAKLKAKQIRIDCGGPTELTDEMFDIIIKGYRNLVARCREVGLELIMENHWGGNSIPENVVRILDAVDGLGLLFDSHNWAKIPGTKERGWELCAPYARSVHIKTFSFDANGNEAETDVSIPIRLLVEAGYNDVWGIESVPKDGDEYGAVKKTRALIERILGEL
jgi:sugar phosphate isomerase/epimerase